MKNRIYKIDDSFSEVFGYTEKEIIISSKKHSSFESLLSSSKKSRVFERVKIIRLRSLKEIVYNEKGEFITFTYIYKNKIVDEDILLKNISSRVDIASDISKFSGFKRMVTNENRIMPLLKNIFYILLTVLFSFLFYFLADNASNGNHYVASGRRAGFKQLITDLVEFIGPNGVVIIGFLSLSFIVSRSYKRFSHPSLKIIWKR